VNLRWPGSKRRLAKTILSLAPPGWREYREPFCGNASILWAMNTKSKSIWLNDINPALMAYYAQLTADDSDLIERLDLLVQSSVLPGQIIERFQALKNDFLNDDPVGLLFLSRLAFGEMVRKCRKDVCSYDRKYLSSINCLTRQRLTRARDILLAAQNLRITCGDYYPVLEAPGKDTWIFLDPPYYVNSNRYSLYDDHLSRDQHIELCERLKCCKHRFLLTIGNSVFENWLYRNSGFRVMTVPYVDGVPRRANRPRTCELIVMNY